MKMNTFPHHIYLINDNLVWWILLWNLMRTWFTTLWGGEETGVRRAQNALTSNSNGRGGRTQDLNIWFPAICISKSVSEKRYHTWFVLHLLNFFEEIQNIICFFRIQRKQCTLWRYWTYLTFCKVINIKST